jgi:phytoene synthase
MGRVYFPKNELRRFGLSFDEILSLKKTDRFIRFLKFQIARARKYYQEAIDGLSMIRKDVRTVISLAFTLYREILSVIEENNYEVFSRRAYVNTFRKVILYIRISLFGVPAAC